MTTLKLGEQRITQTTFEVGNIKIHIDTYHCLFNRWQQLVDFDTYGGKAILNWNNEPLFAELYVLRILETQGYTGVWVDTYRGKFWKSHPSFSGAVALLPPILSDKYETIKCNNVNKRKGCWDVLAVKDEHILFAELKRLNRDNIRQSQIDWLYAAINSGLSASNFIIVEWDYL